MHGVAGPSSEFSTRLAGLLADSPALSVRTLINADTTDADDVMLRCRQFAAEAVPGGALVITILHVPPPGLDHFDRHAANAVLWAFTRQSALAWAPRGIRVNAVGLEAGPASIADVVRTIRAVAGFASMTGQIIRLGTAGRSTHDRLGD